MTDCSYNLQDWDSRCHLCPSQVTNPVHSPGPVRDATPRYRGTILSRMSTVSVKCCTVFFAPKRRHCRLRTTWWCHRPPPYPGYHGCAGIHSEFRLLCVGRQPTTPTPVVTARHKESVHIVTLIQTWRSDIWPTCTRCSYEWSLFAGCSCLWIDWSYWRTERRWRLVQVYPVADFCCWPGVSMASSTRVSHWVFGEILDYHELF